MVKKIVESIGVPVSDEAIQIGLNSEQPCRLERVSDLKLTKAIGNDQNLPIVYLYICHNP